MAVTIYRVVVRGQFADLLAAQRVALLAEVDDHDIFKAAYTEWGSFTYERPLVWFQFRYELRMDEDSHDGAAAPSDPLGDPVAVGLAKAIAQLAEWGIGHKHLRATATDMSTMWSA